MNYILYRIETYGIKNISKLVSFDFASQTVTNKIVKNQSKIKAIYGTNGAGKSAFMNSIEIYKKLNLDPNYLKQNENIIKLNKILNKENENNKEFYFSVIYGEVNNKILINVFKHQLKLKIMNKIPYITDESLSILKDKTINGVYQDIYKITDGELQIYCNEVDGINELLYEKTKNILQYSTLSSLAFENYLIPVIKNILEDKTIKLISDFKSKILYSMICNNYFSKEITIFLDEKDIHNEQDSSNVDLLIEQLEKHRELFKNRISSNEDLVLKNEYAQYEKNVKKLFKFLKLFKPDLLDIRIEKKEDEYFYHCSKKMVYEKYEIDTDYESTGIQKLMKLFSAIEDVVKGKMVFIDELDANINGVYLNTLIEYLNDLQNGQLCFTLHNLYPMKYLYKYSNAIDFIGETGKIVSWVKNGNSRPYEKYPEGMIEDSPFNIESFDFISVFESEEE